MMAQQDLARAFENGATSGRASSVKITEFRDGHALVDTRGKAAVLAYRYPSGEVVAFEGWYGYSPSTSAMLTKMGLSPTARHDDDRQYRANATSADAPSTRAPTRRRTPPDYGLGEWLDDHNPTFIGEPIA